MRAKPKIIQFGSIQLLNLYASNYRKYNSNGKLGLIFNIPVSFIVYGSIYFVARLHTNSFIASKSIIIIDKFQPNWHK